MADGRLRGRDEKTVTWRVAAAAAAAAASVRPPLDDAGQRSAETSPLLKASTVPAAVHLGRCLAPSPDRTEAFGNADSFCTSAGRRMASSRPSRERSCRPPTRENRTTDRRTAGSTTSADRPGAPQENRSRRRTSVRPETSRSTLVLESQTAFGADRG